MVMLIPHLKFFLGLVIETVPLANDLGDDLRLTHFGELMLVLVVLLARELSVNLTHHVLLGLPHLIYTKWRNMTGN